jgi:hypothetical protein
MTLLYKTAAQIPFNDAATLENKADLAHLLRVLSVAECIVKEADFEEENDLGSGEAYAEFLETMNGAFTPSIFDLSRLPPSRQKHTYIISSSSSAIPSRSVVVNSHDFMTNTDPFEPTPIGPCIHVVRDVPLSSLLSDRTPQPNDCHRWSDVVSNNTNTTEDASSLEPLPITTSSYIINSNSTRPPSRSTLSNSDRNSSSSNNRKFQDDQWKQRFQDLLEFERKHGHLLVPHAYSENPKLSQWVKR